MGTCTPTTSEIEKIYRQTPSGMLIEVQKTDLLSVFGVAVGMGAMKKLLQHHRFPHLVRFLFFFSQILFEVKK